MGSGFIYQGSVYQGLTSDVNIEVKRCVLGLESGFSERIRISMFYVGVWKKKLLLRVRILVTLINGSKSF